MFKNKGGRGIAGSEAAALEAEQFLSQYVTRINFLGYYVNHLKSCFDSSDLVCVIHIVYIHSYWYIVPQAKMFDFTELRRSRIQQKLRLLDSDGGG